MNRADFQKLAAVRIREADVLLKARCYDGAYYLCGYAVECALKACIAKKTKRHDFPPPRSIVDGCYTHDLTRLLRVAELDVPFADAMRDDPILSAKWESVQLWSEQSRYERASRQDAVGLFDAVTNPEHGVLPWLSIHW